MCYIKPIFFFKFATANCHGIICESIMCERKNVDWKIFYLKFVSQSLKKKLKMCYIHTSLTFFLKFVTLKLLKENLKNLFFGIDDIKSKKKLLKNCYIATKKKLWIKIVWQKNWNWKIFSLKIVIQ